MHKPHKKSHRRRVYKNTADSAPLWGSLMEYADNVELAGTDEYDDLQVPLAPSLATANSPIDSLLPADNQQDPVLTQSPFLRDPSVASPDFGVPPQDYDPLVQEQDPVALSALSQQDVNGMPLDVDGTLSLLDVSDKSSAFMRRKNGIVFEDQQAAPRQDSGFIDVISTNSEADVQEADWRDKKHYVPAPDAVEADADPGTEEWNIHEKPPALVAQAEVDDHTKASFIERSSQKRPSKFREPQWLDARDFSR